MRSWIGPNPGTVLNLEVALSQLTEVIPRRITKTGPNLEIVASPDPNHAPDPDHVTVQIPNQNPDLAPNPGMIRKKVENSQFVHCESISFLL